MNETRFTTAQRATRVNGHLIQVAARRGVGVSRPSHRWSNRLNRYQSWDKALRRYV